VEEREEYLNQVMGPAIVDCKSLWDSTTKTGAPTVEDKLAALDVICIRSHAKRAGIPLRWAPTDRQVADGLTKNTADAGDLLRSLLRRGVYALAEESGVLAEKAKERQHRLEVGKQRAAKAAEAQASGKLPAGSRDYWANSSSKHYLVKVLGNKIGSDEEILRVKIHKVPRKSALGWGEGTGFPINGKYERITLLRDYQVNAEGKATFGPLEIVKDSWNDPVWHRDKEWIGATAVIKRLK
jgi:hypothetical protein